MWATYPCFTQCWPLALHVSLEAPETWPRRSEARQNGAGPDKKKRHVKNERKKKKRQKMKKWSTRGKHSRRVCSSLLFNPFTPKSDHFQISPEAHQKYYHTVWRTWLFIAYSEWKIIILAILTTSLIYLSLKGWENVRGCFHPSAGKTSDLFMTKHCDMQSNWLYSGYSIAEVPTCFNDEAVRLISYFSCIGKKRQTLELPGRAMHSQWSKD